MNIQNTLIVSAALSTSLVLVTALVVFPVGALSLGVKATLSASSTGEIHAEAAIAAKLNDIIVRSDTAIASRVTALTALSTRIASFKNVSVATKTSLTNSIQANSTGLSILKNKIDTDTDASIAQSDEKMITASYRIYALVIPQGYILASADRVHVIADMMTTLSTQLQARITSAQAAGKNVTAMQTTFADFNAKIADASVHASLAESSVASLMPDLGNKATLEANTSALKAARADIKTSSQDLESARVDAKAIVKEMGTINVKASSTVTITQ
jgi:hypothetical protein